MAKEKKIVNITDEDEKTGEKFGKDKHGKIIKLEDKGDSEKRANQKRIIAVVLWLVAIFFEVIGILRLNGTIEWFSNLNTTQILLIKLKYNVQIRHIFLALSLELWKIIKLLNFIERKYET